MKYYCTIRKGACKMRLHPRARSPLRRASRVGDTNGVLSFPHCFVTNDVVEWRVSNSGSIRSAQERRESSLSSLISCRDKSWESYSAREGGGLPRFITLGACSTLFPPPLSAIYRPVLLAAFGMIGHVDNASRISVRSSGYIVIGSR